MFCILITNVCADTKCIAYAYALLENYQNGEDDVEAGNIAVLSQVPHWVWVQFPIWALYDRLVSSPSLLLKDFLCVLQFFCSIQNLMSLVCLFLLIQRALLESSACTRSKASLFIKISNLIDMSLCVSWYWYMKELILFIF